MALVGHLIVIHVAGRVGDVKAPNFPGDTDHRLVQLKHPLMKTPEYQYSVAVLMFLAASVIFAATSEGYLRWLLVILIIVVGSAVVIAIERSGRRR
jgi:hypothetical protein